ncbi:hypothetical protein LCGC14_0501120 [marine sediment metagenome]|uniref:Uncharacterized protein n=1 Tax=marine sediment metagenome TaxID=412755 RepID=A0A0F9SMC6_9ZZZZ|nr:hypothetical protein [Candidatus Aminicenantes bacterium]
MEIKKAKLVKDATMEISYIENIVHNEGETNEYSTRNKFTGEFEDVVHDDLKEAFAGLVHHFAIICEQIQLIEGTELKDYTEILEDYKVTAMSLGGKPGAEGVVITGQRILTSGMVLQLNTPFILFESEGGYKQSEELLAACKKVVTEVREYLNGKQGDHQLDLEFATDDKETS